jgi:membrane protein
MPAIVKPVSISWMDVLRQTLKEANEDDVLGRSAQLSYYFFLAFFPMLICMMAVLSVFSGSGEHFRQGLVGVLAGVMPGSASEIIAKTLTEVSPAHAGSKVSLSLIFSLWSASAGMSAIMDTLNAEYEVHETRSFLRRNAMAIGLTVLSALLLLAAVAIVLAGGSSARAFSHGLVASLLKIAQWPVALALGLLVFALIYFFAPDVKDQKWHWVTPGAVVGLVLWLAASLALKIYLHFFNSYSATYGSLGAVIILLLWFYVTGAALLLGAEINSVLEDAAAESGEPDAKLKGEKAPGDCEAATPRTQRPLGQDHRTAHP